MSSFPHNALSLILQNTHENRLSLLQSFFTFSSHFSDCDDVLKVFFSVFGTFFSTPDFLWGHFNLGMGLCDCVFLSSFTAPSSEMYLGFVFESCFPRGLSIIVLRRREILPSFFCKELELSVMRSEFTQERGIPYRKRVGMHAVKALEALEMQMSNHTCCIVRRG